MTGRSPTGPGSRASHEAASASSPKASIPNARPLIPLKMLPARVLQWSMDSGYLTMTYPALITPEEVEEVERVLAITVGIMKRAASAIEARGAETHGGSVEDESAVAESETPND